MKLEKHWPTPEGPGLYLARLQGFQWWNLVVQVEGKAPFLTYIGYERLGNQAFDRRWTLFEKVIWGPKIEEPDVEQAV